MEEKKIQEKPVEQSKKVVLKSPFVPRKSIAKGQGNFDTDYEKITIVDRVKKIGDGDDDFIIEKKVLVDKTPIKDVVNADKDSVGIENIIKQVLRTGDTSLLPIDKGDCNIDLVGAPENLMEVKQLGVDAEKKFKSLPEELVSGMDMTSFVNSMSQEKFDEFIAALEKRAAKKEEVKENG